MEVVTVPKNDVETEEKTHQNSDQIASKPLHNDLDIKAAGDCNWKQDISNEIKLLPDPLPNTTSMDISAIRKSNTKDDPILDIREPNVSFHPKDVTTKTTGYLSDVKNGGVENSFVNNTDSIKDDMKKSVDSVVTMLPSFDKDGCLLAVKTDGLTGAPDMKDQFITSTYDKLKDHTNRSVDVAVENVRDSHYEQEMGQPISYPVQGNDHGFVSDTDDSCNMLNEPSTPVKDEPSIISPLISPGNESTVSSGSNYIKTMMDVYREEEQFTPVTEINPETPIENTGVHALSTQINTGAPIEHIGTHTLPTQLNIGVPIENTHTLPTEINTVEPLESTSAHTLPTQINAGVPIAIENTGVHTLPTEINTLVPTEQFPTQINIGVPIENIHSLCTQVNTVVPIENTGVHSLPTEISTIAPTENTSQQDEQSLQTKQSANNFQCDDSKELYSLVPQKEHFEPIPQSDIDNQNPVANENLTLETVGDVKFSTRDVPSMKSDCELVPEVATKDMESQVISDALLSDTIPNSTVQLNQDVTLSDPQTMGQTHFQSNDIKQPEVVESPVRKSTPIDVSSNISEHIPGLGSLGLIGEEYSEGDVLNSDDTANDETPNETCLQNDGSSSSAVTDDQKGTEADTKNCVVNMEFNSCNIPGLDLNESSLTQEESGEFKPESGEGNEESVMEKTNKEEDKDICDSNDESDKVFIAITPQSIEKPVEDVTLEMRDEEPMEDQPANVVDSGNVLDENKSVSSENFEQQGDDMFQGNDVKANLSVCERENLIEQEEEGNDVEPPCDNLDKIELKEPPSCQNVSIENIPSSSINELQPLIEKEADANENKGSTVSENFRETGSQEECHNEMIYKEETLPPQNEGLLQVKPAKLASKAEDKSPSRSPAEAKSEPQSDTATKQDDVPVSENEVNLEKFKPENSSSENLVNKVDPIVEQPFLKNSLNMDTGEAKLTKIPKQHQKLPKDFDSSKLPQESIDNVAANVKSALNLVKTSLTDGNGVDQVLSMLRKTVQAAKQDLKYRMDPLSSSFLYDSDSSMENPTPSPSDFGNSKFSDLSSAFPTGNAKTDCNFAVPKVLPTLHDNVGEKRNLLSETKDINIMTISNQSHAIESPSKVKNETNQGHAIESPSKFKKETPNTVQENSSKQVTVAKSSHAISPHKEQHTGSGKQSEERKPHKSTSNKSSDKNLKKSVHSENNKPEQKKSSDKMSNQALPHKRSKSSHDKSRSSSSEQQKSSGSSIHQKYKSEKHRNSSGSSTSSSNSHKVKTSKEEEGSKKISNVPSNQEKIKETILCNGHSTNEGNTNSESKSSGSLLQNAEKSSKDNSSKSEASSNKEKSHHKHDKHRHKHSKHHHHSKEDRPHTPSKTTEGKTHTPVKITEEKPHTPIKMTLKADSHDGDKVHYHIEKAKDGKGRDNAQEKSRPVSGM